MDQLRGSILLINSLLVVSLANIMGIWDGRQAVVPSGKALRNAGPEARHRLVKSIQQNHGGMCHTGHLDREKSPEPPPFGSGGGGKCGEARWRQRCVGALRRVG